MRLFLRGSGCSNPTLQRLAASEPVFATEAEQAWSALLEVQHPLTAILSEALRLRISSIYDGAECFNLEEL